MTDSLYTPTREHAVVVGVGYVGLTLLCALGNAGFSACGYDINNHRAALVARGEMPFEGGEQALAETLLHQVREGNISATSDPGIIEQAGIIFIAVETPVDAYDHRPRYTALRRAVATVGEHLSPGAVIIVESTIAPGTMQQVVLPLLRETVNGIVGEDFFLVHCPERVMPGRLLQNITTCDRIVGGMTPACTTRGVEIYSRITSGALHPTNALTAEIVKTAENAYRDVQIAFANELALICEELDADAYEVRELVNSSPYRQMHLPGAGVGGHCIPKDSWLLCSAVSRYQPRLLPTARHINDSMPLHIFNLLEEALRQEGRVLDEAVITILGASYLEGTDDTRNSPTLLLVQELHKRGSQIRIIDPYANELDEWPVTPDIAAMSGSDAAVLMTAHHAFREINWAACAKQMRTPILIDGRNVFTSQDAREAGLRYVGLGKGSYQQEIEVL